MQFIEENRVLKRPVIESINYLSAKILMLLSFLVLSFSMSAQLSLDGPLTIDFTGYAGAGLDSSPAVGQLDSDDWAIDGFSSAADLTRGITTAAVSTGGLYALDQGGDIALWVQPGGSDMTPGSITAKVENNTGGDVAAISIAYDVLYRNDQSRSNSINFSYSTNGMTFTPVSGLDFSTPGASDALGVVAVSKTETIAIAASGDFYLRWAIDDAGGSGSRDELGLDNIIVTSLGVHNVNSDEYFLTIQAAIDDANTVDGHVINVSAGTYDESILINKQLTINGPNAAVNAVDGTRVAEAIITKNLRISATSSVSLNGFEFNGVTTMDSWPIYITSSSDDITINNNKFVANAATAIKSGLTNTLTNLTIQGNLINGSANDVNQSGMALGGVSGSISNNKIINPEYAGIIINGADGLAITNNDISNSSQQGLQLAANCADVTVSDNTITNANTDGLADKGAVRIYGSDFTGPVEISNNTLTGSFNGVAIKDGQVIATDIKIENNDLSGNSNFGIYNGATTGTVSADFNWWGHASGPMHISNPTGTGVAMSNDVDYCMWLDNLPGIGVPINNTGVVANTTRGTYFCTIQEAIDDVATVDFDVLEVGEGTYNENVVVDKGLIIRAVSGELVTVSGTTGDGFTINSDDVTLDDITITGFGTGVRINTSSNAKLFNIKAENNTTYGINVATGPINNLTIFGGTYSGSSVGMKVASATSISGLSIDLATFSGNNQGFGWFASNSTPSTIENVMISNTTFFQNAQKGLYIEKLSDATFDNITIDECGTDVNYGSNSALDLNLKFGVYENITLNLSN